MLAHFMCFIFLLCHCVAMPTTPAAAQPLATKPNRCKSVCGVSEESFINPPKLLPKPPLTLPPKKKSCAKREIQKGWKKLAVQFMQGLGRNDTFRCVQQTAGKAPKHFRQHHEWQYLWQPNFYLSPYGKQQENASTVSNSRSVKRKNPVQAKCKIHVDRGIYRVRLNETVNRTMENTLWIIRLPLRPSIFALVNNETHQVETFHLKRFNRDNCTKTLSCHPSKTLRFSKIRNKLSMFGRMKLNNMPGVGKTVTLLQERQEQLDAVLEDISWSNLAILCLPLLMSIPPISLLETVSTVAIIAYVVATDILAVCPLLIKGIELVVTSRRNSTAEGYGMLSLTGDQYGIFERWYVECESNRPYQYNLAAGLIGAAIWFMFASTLTEYLFWRAAKSRRKYGTSIPVLNGIPVTHCQTCGACTLNRETSRNNLGPAYEMDQTPEDDQPYFTRALITSSIRGTLWDGKRKFTVLLLIPSIILYVSAILFSHLALHICTALLLLFFHFYSTSRQFRISSMLGILLGFVSGPIYLLFHLFTSVRNSAIWGRVSDGCNIGASFLATTGLFVLTSGKEIRIPPIIVFCWVYGALVVVVHIIRCKSEDRYLWEHAILSFGLGMLFGPLGSLFMPLFRDSEIDIRVKSQVYLGCGFGFMFTVTVITAIFVFIGPNLQDGHI